MKRLIMMKAVMFHWLYTLKPQIKSQTDIKKCPVIRIGRRPNIEMTQTARIAEMAFAEPITYVPSRGDKGNDPPPYSSICTRSLLA